MYLWQATYLFFKVIFNLMVPRQVHRSSRSNANNQCSRGWVIHEDGEFKLVIHYEISCHHSTSPCLDNKKRKVQRDNHCQASFDKILTALGLKPVMTFYDSIHKSKLKVDGFKKKGLPSILSRVDPRTKLYKMVR